MTMFSRAAEHRLNRAILYSAIVLRKIIEEEAEAEKIITASRKNAMSEEDLETFFRNQGMSDEVVRLFVEANKQPPAFATLHYMVEIMEFPYKSEDDLTVRGMLSADNYGAGKKTTLALQKICNHLVHSYVWSLTRDDDEKCYSGFMVSSDKFRGEFVCFISFDEWLKAIETAIEHSVI